VVTPSPASSAASYPAGTFSTVQVATSYRHASSAAAAVATKSQVSVLQKQKQQLQQQQQQKRDAGSISTSATQSSNDHSPRSNHSSDDPQQQQQQPSQQQQQHQLHQHHRQHQHFQQQTQQEQQQQWKHPYSQQSQPAQQPQQQQQQQQQQAPHNKPTTAPSPTSFPPRDLNPTDALSLKRDGPEATIVALRQALEVANVRDVTERTNLAKSEATILELRSSVRQLKRQLEKLDGEARQKHVDWVHAKQQLQQTLKQQQQQLKHVAQQQHDDTTLSSSHMSLSQQSQEHALAKEERVGEMQVMLDRAHAQLLTADMVRKELEDTLEAEQYTWELRVQDQERTIVDLQQEIAQLTEDLEQCRLQWKQADQHWAEQVAELQQTLMRLQQQQQQQDQQQPSETGESNKNINNNNNNTATNTQVLELHGKLRQLEDERNELQTCLDEALLELEAVDAELGNHTPAEVQQLRQENQRLQEAVSKQRALQQKQQLQLGDAEYDTLEGLQHLYRWLLERSQEGEEKKNDTVPQTSPELLDAIHHVLESVPSLRQDQQRSNSNNNTTNTSSLSDATALAEKVVKLESQIVVYREEVQQREQSTSELRTNLQEAVALIKPLQDAVDKADRQKNDLQQEIEGLRNDHETETRELLEELRTRELSLRQREQECDRLHHDIHRLQIELEDAKEIAQVRQTLHGLSPSAAAAAATAAKTPPPSEQPQELSSLSKARADLQAKRAQEQTLRSLLRDAQSRFQSLNQQNQSVEALNQQLQGRLRDVEEHGGHADVTDEDIPSIVTKLEEQLSTLKAQLQDKTAELENLREEAQRPSPELMKRIYELEERLAKSQSELKQRLQSEKVLNKSLKDALGLLKPLKNHLEEAEAENKDLSKEVKTLRRKVTSMEISGMGTVVASQNGVEALKSASDSGNLAANNHPDEKILREKEQLEETVRHLEQENSQLHDALDELSRMNDGGMSPKASGNSIVSSKAEVRLNQEIVELKSRYEVTQSRLEDAYVENHTLVEALIEKEESEKDAVEGMRILREKLRKTEMDLQNAKYIATSALVKVEQAKSLENNVSINSGFESESHTVLSLEEKAIELGVRLSSASLSQSPSNNGVKARQFHNQSHHPQQEQQQQPSYNSEVGGQPKLHHNGTNHTNGWAGKRSRLADF
jgi:hypothetical protein